MNTWKSLLAVGLVLTALAGRQLLPGGGDEVDEPSVPVSRLVEDVPFDPQWTPDPDRRDPFVPLILPVVPVESETGDSGDDGFGDE
jgi:hypothetical protein